MAEHENDHQARRQQAIAEALERAEHTRLQEISSPDAQQGSGWELSEGPGDGDTASNGDEDHLLASNTLTGATSVPQRRRAANSSNDVEFAKQEAKRLRLDEAGMAGVVEFAKLSVEHQNIRMYARQEKQQKTLDKLEQKINEKEAIELDHGLVKNLTKYAHVILLSPTLHDYGGATPLNHLVKLFYERPQLGLPKGMDENKKLSDLFMSEARRILTQRKGTFKKELKASYEGKQGGKQLNLYKLTLRLIGDTGCSPTLDLMARAAVMRRICKQKPPEGKYWQLVDEALDAIRKDADGDPLALGAALQYEIQEDRKLHGQNEDDELEVAKPNNPAWIVDVEKVVNGPGNSVTNA